MFDESVLAEPEMAVDVVHDGRHALDQRPMARESIPFIVVIPKERIAFFTYTWVTKDSEAGAALAIFGPGLGRDPIQQRLPDRKVPTDMGFDDWRIDDFRMRQDLAFDKASIHWESDEAVLDFTFEASHPPYGYGKDPRGCPAYAADDRIEQAGKVKGTLKLGNREIVFESTGHRDHSWGNRDWIAFQHYEWFVGQAGDDFAVHFWKLQALGRDELRGYVFKDGLMSRIEKLDLAVDYDAQYLQQGYEANITDAAGRKTVVKADVFGHYPLIPDPAITLMESGAKATFDGREGVGWMECAWPTEYLRHIRGEKA